jgi:hypothetical protein
MAASYPRGQRHERADRDRFDSALLQLRPQLPVIDQEPGSAEPLVFLAVVFGPFARIVTKITGMGDLVRGPVRPDRVTSNSSKGCFLMTQLIQIGQPSPAPSSVLEMFQRLARQEAEEIRRLRQTAATPRH